MTSRGPFQPQSFCEMALEEKGLRWVFYWGKNQLNLSLRCTLAAVKAN